MCHLCPTHQEDDGVDEVRGELGVEVREVAVCGDRPVERRVRVRLRRPRRREVRPGDGSRPLEPEVQAHKVDGELRQNGEEHERV